MENENDELDISAQSWNKLQRSLHYEGYREGSSAGRDSTFQEGFDSGYLQGFQVGYKLGMHNGVLKFMSTEGTNLDSTLKEHLKTVQPFEKPARGLCVVCLDEEKRSSETTETVADQTTVKQVSEVLQQQKNAVDAAEKSVFTEEYLLVLRNTHLNHLFDR
uniref:Essential protein Yae1 N-terminal domain-containing protein n=1 Tax=Graphocephala atropunctata TaxID=36148 RepID=A0A1B6M955_9HEMI